MDYQAMIAEALRMVQAERSDVRETIRLSVCETLFIAWEATPKWLPKVSIARRGKGDIEITSFWMLNLEAIEILNAAKEAGCAWAEEAEAQLAESKPKDPPLEPSEPSRQTGPKPERELGHPTPGRPGGPQPPPPRR